MKNKIALSLAIVLIFTAFLNLSVMAEENIPTWPSNVTAKTVTVDKIDGPGGAAKYRYVPDKTTKYAIKFPSSSCIFPDVEAVDGDHPNGEEFYDEASNTQYEIYDLIAGREYVIYFYYSINGDQSAGKYSQEVSIIKWDNTLLIPDYPYIKDNEKKTVTVKQDEYVSFLFYANTTGTYCVGHNTSNIYVSIGSTMVSPQQEGHSPEMKGDWYTDTQQGHLFHLEKGNTYVITAGVHGFDPKVTDTVWIRKGDAPKNDYENWDINKSKKISINGAGERKYYLNVSESGKYMLIEPTSIYDVYIYEEGNDSVPTTEFDAHDYLSGKVYDFVAGKQYVVSVACNEFESQNGTPAATYRFEKVGKLKSASLYIAYISNHDCAIGINTEPIAAGAVEGVKWSFSDPSAFTIIGESDSLIHLKLDKKGKTKVTAKVGSITTSIVVDTNMSIPVIKEGETKEIRTTVHGENAIFTPSKSGNYKITVVPKKRHQDHVPSVSCSLLYNPNYDPVFSLSEVSTNHTAIVNLKAGVKYYLGSWGGTFSIRIERASGSSQTIKPPQSNATSSNKPNPESDVTQSQETTSKVDPGEEQNTQSEITKPEDNFAKPITKEDVDNALEFAIGAPIIFASQSRSDSFDISADALSVVAKADSEIILAFAEEASIKLDAAAINSINQAANGKNVMVSLEHKALTDLNAEQQKALENESVEWLVDVNLTADGKHMHNLGGKAQIIIPNPDKTQSWSVLYIAEDGSCEYIDATCDENITITTEHFSHYALVKGPHAETTKTLGVVIPVVIAVVLVIFVALVTLAIAAIVIIVTLAKKKKANNLE